MTAISRYLRSQYFPNPIPNTFFSGNADLYQDYYSFEWGSALFVMINPFLETYNKLGWGWSLGLKQYNWLASVLQNSSAIYKFVFGHNLVGGFTNEARGGIEFANLFEWGGYNQNGTYGFDQYRPGWGKPIHQLFIDNNVRAFFHGHDHLYVKQTLDGIVYQEVPQPSHGNLGSSAIPLAKGYGYSNGTLMGYNGHLLVNVTAQSATVYYMMYDNAVVEDSYTFFA